jgi:predicted aspartyl protease
MKKFVSCCGLILLFIAPSAYASEPFKSVPMHTKNADTYYIKADIGGTLRGELMVDTGSGYIVLSENTLDTLLAQGKARYRKDIVGKLADGSRKVVSIWNVSEISLGGVCQLTNVEVAVFPGNQRQILGLRALKRAAPFTFSFDPPALQLARCDSLT